VTNLIRGQLKTSTLRDIAALRERIQLDPDYQRAGDIWSLSRRKLLIDSILNDFDVPKLYFRALVPPEYQGERLVAYTVIDGRQRLEAIWAFMDGDLFLDADAEIDGLVLPEGEAATFQAMRHWLPLLVDRFLNYQLDVVTIETDDLDVIEDMFLRLNEASALNAAEKRNAFGGPIPAITRELSTHEFFVDRLPYPNRRYRHFDIATKFLHFEERGGVADTKKTYLDRFVRSARHSTPAGLDEWRERVVAVMDVMAEVFSTRDKLLTAVGMASIYYLVVRQAMDDGWVSQLQREKFEAFERERQENRAKALQDDATANYNMLEFDRYAQSPNDAVALRFRRDVLLEYLGRPLEPAGQDGYSQDS
jgi:hypothetical protein